MYARFFAQEVNLYYEKNNDLISATKKGFFPLTSSEVGLFHCVVMKLLEDLNPKNENFDFEYNQIVFGGMLIELAMETDKYYASNKEELYAKTVNDLMEICGIEKMPDPIILWQRQALRENANCINLIKGVGQRILNGELEFSRQHLDYHFQTASKFLQNHQTGTCPSKDESKNNIIAFNQLLEQRHKQFAPSSLKCSQ